jgi:carbon starvation protein CstA
LRSFGFNVTKYSVRAKTRSVANWIWLVAILISGISAVATPTMHGFVQSYYAQRQDVKASERIMYYFAAERLPVLTTLAREYALFSRWFSSVPAVIISARRWMSSGLPVIRA